jgi:hypothetical protein
MTQALYAHTNNKTNKQKNAKGELTTNTMEIQENIRDYFESL